MLMVREVSCLMLLGGRRLFGATLYLNLKAYLALAGTRPCATVSAHPPKIKRTKSLKKYKSYAQGAKEG